MEELESMELCQCICTELHLNCNANTCKEAAIRRSTKLFLPPVCPSKESYPLVSGLGDISSRAGQWALDTNLLRVRDSMRRGCTTCALIYEGLVNEMDASEHSEFKLTYGSGHVELDPDMDMYYDLYVAEDSCRSDTSMSLSAKLLVVFPLRIGFYRTNRISVLSKLQGVSSRNAPSRKHKLALELWKHFGLDSGLRAVSFLCSKHPRAATKSRD